MAEYQTRWLAYCRATGVAPDEAWARDGNGAPYIVWIQRRWQEWRKLTGFTASAGATEHADFDRWLWATVQPQTELLEVRDAA